MIFLRPFAFGFVAALLLSVVGYLVYSGIRSALDKRRNLRAEKESQFNKVVGKVNAYPVADYLWRAIERLERVEDKVEDLQRINGSLVALHGCMRKVLEAVRWLDADTKTMLALADWTEWADRVEALLDYVVGMRYHRDKVVGERFDVLDIWRSRPDKRKDRS